MARRRELVKRDRTDAGVILAGRLQTGMQFRRRLLFDLMRHYPPAAASNFRDDLGQLRDQPR